MMKNLLSAAICFPLAVYLTVPATAQPVSGKTLKNISLLTYAPTTPTITVGELEKLLNGRTTLTLDLRQATPANLAAAIESQTTIAVAAHSQNRLGRADTAYNIKANGDTFWEAIRSWQDSEEEAPAATNESTIFDSTGSPISAQRQLNPHEVGLANSDTGRGYVLAPQNIAQLGRASKSWPFLLTANSVLRVQAAVIKPDPVEPMQWRDGMEIQINALLEPKLHLMNDQIRVRVTEAIDENGNDYGQETADEPINLQPRGQQRQLKIRLRPPTTEAQRLVSLRGTLTFQVVTRTQDWEVTDPNANNLTRRFSQNGYPATLSFSGLAKTARGWQMNFSQRETGEAALRGWYAWRGSSRSRHTGIDLRLMDGTGRELVVNSSGTRISLSGGDGRQIVPSGEPVNTQNWTLQAEARYEFSYPPQSGSGAVGGFAQWTRLVMAVPTEWREVSVPFEFKDLPLPPA